MTNNLPVKVGMIGCGNISSTYLEVIGTLEAIDVVACADISWEAAETQAAKYQIDKVYSGRRQDVEELLADPEIEIVLNLTTPNAHGTVGLAALNAGKSLYNEKPLALTREEGRQMLDLAEQKGVLIGCAPDTFMGGGLQTCRQLIDEGAIGTPLAASAFMMIPGHEYWHPSPEFYYQVGGGPMFDMGPYYLTALVSLLGPVDRITGSARISRSERPITSQPKFGTMMKVEVPTHVTGVMDFASGIIGTIITSFDIQASALPRIEIYGTEATLSVPDPNRFDGPVQLRKGGKKEKWQDIPLTHGHTAEGRGLGVADMALALRSGHAHRANGDMAYHVLDIMHGIHEASESGQHIILESTCQQPLPLPTELIKRTYSLTL